MIFASKTPRDLNRDPEPWVTKPQLRAEFGRPKHHAESIDCYAYCVRDPRPEFDHVQHNHPNPILLDFRETNGIAELWLEAIEGKDGDVFLAGVPKAFGAIRAPHIDHARRVLGRLARLTKESA